jgi:hypothetical protein
MHTAAPRTLAGQVSTAALALTLVAVAPARAQIGGVPGGPVIYTGGDVTLTLLFQEALFENELFVFRSAIGNTFDPANAINVFSNKAGIGSTFTFNPAADLGLSVGDEIIFGICTNVPEGDSVSCGSFGDANAVLYSGPASRNFDNAVHAEVAQACAGAYCGSFTGTAVAFEDIREVNPDMIPPDRDFNDIVFGVTQTVVPEPVTMTLLATGLAGMSGATIWKRRKRAA